MTKFTVRRLTHRNTLARSEGAQKQREAAASAPRLSSSSTPLASSPPQPTPSRRLCSRPRHRHPGVDLSASIVAAFERIFISEPVMAAGSSSSAGGDGLSLLPHWVSSFTDYAIDLETLALDVKKRKGILLDSCTVRS